MLLALIFVSVAEGQTEGSRLDLWDAIEQAVAYHPAIRVSRSQLDAARHRRSRATSEWIPAVSIDASATRFQEEMIVRPLHAFDPTNPPDFNSTLLQGGAMASLTLWDASRAARIGAAREGAEAQRARLAESEQGVILRVVDVYARIIAMRSTLEAASVRVAAFEAELERANRMVTAEVAPRVEVLRAQAALEVARGDLSVARLQGAALVAELARITGAMNGVSIGSLANVTIFHVPPLNDSGDDAIASPVMEAAMHSADAADARARAARGSRWPILTARAGYLWFAAPSSALTGEWQVGVGLSYPIFSRATSAHIEEAAAAATESRARVDQIRLDLARQMDAAFTELAAAGSRVGALETAVVQFDEVRRIEQLSLETGAGVQSDYLRAEAQLFDTRARLASARADRLVALARLLHTRGDLSVSQLRTHVEATP